MTLWDRADRVFTHQTVKCVRHFSKITQCSKEWLWMSLKILQLDVRNTLVHLALGWTNFQVSCRQINTFLHTNLCELSCRNSDSQAHMIPCVYAQIQCKSRRLNTLSIYSKTQLHLQKQPRTYARTHTNTALQLSHFTLLVTRTSGNEVWDVSCLLKCKGTAILLQTRTGPEGSRRLRLPDFKTFGTWRWYGC